MIPRSAAEGQKVTSRNADEFSRSTGDYLCEPGRERPVYRPRSIRQIELPRGISAGYAMYLPSGESE